MTTGSSCHASGAAGRFSRPPQGRRGAADELAPVVDRPVQVELLAQLDLPLAQHRLRRQDQDALRAPGEPRLPQQQAGLDGLAQPHLVGDQQPRRPVRVEALERAHLVGPGDHRGRGLADARPAVGKRRRAGDEPPDEPAAIDRRDRGRRGRLDGRRRGRGRRSAARGVAVRGGQPGRPVARRQEAQQVAPRRVRDVQHDDARRAVGPDAREVPLLLIDARRLRPPARVDVQAFPVAPPARLGLVQAARPRQPVAGAVFDDPRLLVEDRGVGRRPPVRVARHRHLHVEMPAGHHPRQQFQRVGGLRIGRRKGHGGQSALDLLAQRRAARDGLDLGRGQRAADDEAHPPVVAHQPLDAARRQRERPGVEVAGQPVVAGRVFQRRQIEPAHEVAVFRRVLEPPLVVGEHGAGAVRALAPVAAGEAASVSRSAGRTGSAAGDIPGDIQMDVTRTKITEPWPGARASLPAGRGQADAGRRGGRPR